MAIIDTILYYNESDLLEIRMEILGDFVDKFVIVEATKTFIGNSRQLHFNPNRYAKWKDKIAYFVVDELTDEEWENAKASPNTGAGEHWWVREYAIKERMLKALNFYKCNDNDIVFISDLDEIWNPNVLREIEHGEIYRPIQTAYHYYLNNRSDQDITGWVGTRFATYKTIKEFGINHLRTESMHPSIHIPNGGWHFSNIGNADYIRNKLESYGHQEYNIPIVKNKLEEMIEKNIDFVGRNFKLWKDESQLPQWLIEHKNDYKHLFR